MTVFLTILGVLLLSFSAFNLWATMMAVRDFIAGDAFTNRQEGMFVIAFFASGVLSSGYLAILAL